MNTLFRLATASLAIATIFGTSGVNAQQTNSVPSGSVAPDTTTPTNSATPDATAPVVPTQPAMEPQMQGGICNAAKTSSAGADSDSMYTAGPISEERASSSSSSTMTTSSESEGVSNSAETSKQTNLSTPRATSMSDNSLIASSGTTSERTESLSNKGFNTEAPRLIKASSNQAMERHEIGPSHHISLYSGGNPLCYLSIKSVSADIAEFNEKIEVFDKNNNSELDITVIKEQDGGAKVVFAQPVPPKTMLDVVLNGVAYGSQTAPNAVQYSLAGGHTNFNREIPYGVIQVNRFLY